ncbi:MAG TPA: hypothetical protein VKA55_01660 [Gammaproteobacteria bacterium]|nr:hypothetical protein [Gammaproteobacteria bacterium]
MNKAITSPWILPVLLLGAAIALLIGLQQLIGGREAPEHGPGIPRDAAVEAVRKAPADPFRYGGRTIGTVLNQLEPPPGWTDTGWRVTADADGGYRTARRYVSPDGAERVYAFTVGDDLDSVWPANGRARALMHKGPRPRD